MRPRGLERALRYGIPIAVVVAGSLLIIWLGNRAVAVVSFITVIIALTFTYQSTNTARQQAVRSEQQVATAHFQARLAALATAYAYHPVLIPLHEAAAPVDASAQKYFPALDAYKPPAPEATKRVFLVDESLGAVSVYLRNVGAGPAVGIEVRLEDADGEQRVLAGAAAIAAGAEERFTAPSRAGSRRAARTISGSAPWVRKADEKLVPGILADAKVLSRAYLLTIRYRGLVPVPSDPDIVAEAVFDPRGTGRWCLDSDSSIPDANVLAVE